MQATTVKGNVMEVLNGLVKHLGYKATVTETMVTGNNLDIADFCQAVRNNPYILGQYPQEVYWVQGGELETEMHGVFDINPLEGNLYCSMLAIACEDSVIVVITIEGEQAVFVRATATLTGISYSGTFKGELLQFNI
jgi:hypothetical protein